MTAQRWADVQTVHLKCRALGHAWDPVATFVERVDRVEVLRVVLACMRCKSERHDLLRRRDGTREAGPKYGYANGYVLKSRAAWGTRTVFNAEVRRELYSRLVK